MKGKQIRKLKVLAFFAVLVMTTTYTLVLVKAEGPHIETPRYALFNEVEAGDGSWIELVNPTEKNVQLKDWKIQMRDNGDWKDIFVFGPGVIKKWGSGDEYFVTELETILPPEDVNIRLLDDQGSVIDETGYGLLDEGCSWARYKSAETGIPIDTDSPDDWYISQSITKGYSNDMAK